MNRKHAYIIMEDKMEWGDLEHNSVILNVIEKDSNENEQTYQYVAYKNDSTPLAVYLWNEAMKMKDKIQKPYINRLIDGDIEVPHGFTLRDNILCNDEEEKQKVRSTIDGLLDELHSGRNLIKAENDPVYAENRKELIKNLLEVERQTGFPYDVDWSFL